MLTSGWSTIRQTTRSGIICRMRIDKDRLSHWYATGIIAWTVYCLVGILIFHLSLGVSTVRIVVFFGGSCLLQLSLTPWIFWARGLREKPNRQFAHRIAAASVWLVATGILLLCVIQFGQAIDKASLNQRALILLCTTAAFGVLAIFGGRLGRWPARQLPGNKNETGE